MKVKKLPIALLAAALVTVSALGATSSAEEAPARPQITIGRFETAPVIDGNFSEAEWGTKSFTLAEGQPNVNALKEKSGDQELPLTKTVSDVYLGYDDLHLYLCVVADYEKHEAQALLGSKLWNDDCLQTKVSASPDGPNYNDIDFGLNTTTNRALAHVWNGHGVTYGQLSPGKGKDFMITRNGTKTVYEIAYPLKSFASNTVKLKQGDKLAFAIAQHMNNKGGFYEFAGGIVNSKEITSAGILILGEPKNLPSSGKGPSDNTNSSGSTNSSKPGNTQKPGTGASKVSDGKESSVNSLTESTDGSGDSSDVTSDNKAGDVSEIIETVEVVEEGDSGGLTPKVVIPTVSAAVVILGAAFYFLIIRK